MLRHVIAFLTLFAPVKAFGLQSLNQFRYYPNQIICMAPPPGNLSSKTTNSDHLPYEGCQAKSDTVHHDDGSTVEVVSFTCTKKVQRDKNGKVIRETDTSHDKYQIARDFFTGLLIKKD